MSEPGRSETAAHGFLRTIFGSFSWQPPNWALRAKRGYMARAGTYTAALLALVALGGGAYYWAHRPKPVDPEAITFRVDAPARTDYAQDPIQVNPLNVFFSASVAPIDLVEKPTQAIALQPALEGTWTWISDRQLQFKPSRDWPIGTHYEVALDAPGALARGTRLAERRFEFDTAPFSATMAATEFYQDPEESKNKQGIYTVRFSHPVDAASFERRLTLALRDGAQAQKPAPAWSVNYDTSKTVAYVRSAALDIPENGGTLTLAVAPGTQSSLGGSGAGDALQGSVALPSLYSVKVDQMQASVVDNERFEPEQVLIVAFNDQLKDQEVAKAVRAWVLPEHNPKIKENQTTPYAWSFEEVDEGLLQQSQPLQLQPKPTEREYANTHSFRFDAPPGRRLYVRVAKGLKSFGGFLLGENWGNTQTVPGYPELLQFVGDGALLSLRGERRVTVAARNLPGLRLEIARVLPQQLQHLVQYNEGSYQKPHLDDYRLSADSIVERFEKRIALPALAPARTHYEGIDLGEFFTPERHGVFLLSLFRDDPATDAAQEDATEGDAEEGLSVVGAEEDAEGDYEEDGDGEPGAPLDSRLVVLTDLGIVTKRALDDTRSVFVQSLHQGTPVAGARVAVVARNGERLLETSTDGEGSASLASLKGFEREKQPVLLSVAQGDDFSFFPLADEGRKLDFSRFAIEGEVNARSDGALKAHLFSDRGLYRPGETFHIGIIVRAADWGRSLAGVPLEMDVTDPRGTLAKREKITLGPDGFESISHTPSELAATGTWYATLYLLGAKDQRTELGGTTVQVREFQPDRLRVRAQFSHPTTEGWVKPEDLQVRVQVENLFGTPAQDRRVTGSMRLQPAFPVFPRYAQYQFYDPQRAKEGYEDELTDTQTDAQGQAQFDLDLSPYDRATYQLRFLTQAFEAGGGRGVAAETGILVSSNPFLIGLKAVDPLNYVQRGAKREVQALAIGPDARPMAVSGLRSVILEKHYVSVLTKQDSGVYKYVSQLRTDVRKMQPLALPAGGQALPLPTDTPGRFVLEIRDAKDTVLNQLEYDVAGAANLSRSLDRNAELQLTLSRADYRPGEEIEVSVKAPYAGSGLITIERERVYAHRWFKADTTSSVQRITVPAGLEGNAYVNVQFIRDPNSDEVFMSPLSYGVAPFSVDRSARRRELVLNMPQVVKPGATAQFRLQTEGRARVALFAVDEGILQVARYKLGDPLDQFFRKKMLQVDTAQILDLILPEFSKLGDMAAPGGDGDGALGKHLNPFKRRGEKPAVYWSGLTDIEGTHTFSYTVPDSFNGKLRVMAVGVSPDKVGIVQDQTLVRGDFVLSPNVPTQVSPGDEFEVSVGVAHAAETTATAPVPIEVALEIPAALKLLGAAKQTLSLAAGNEGSVSFRLQAGAQLGPVPLRFTARHQKWGAARQVELSLRPNVVYRQDVQTGHTQQVAKIGNLRTMYPQLAKRQATASLSPLAVTDGLAAYLADYPHYCTEQLLSQAIPALVFAQRPEFGTIVEKTPGQSWQGIIDVLRERQSNSGGFGLWQATPDPEPFVSAYASLYLLEAQERGQPIPDDLRDSNSDYLARLAGDAAQNSLAGYRQRALATYLLTRQGQVTTPLLATLQEHLQKDHPQTYRADASAAFLGASYQLLKQDRLAKELIGPSLLRLTQGRAATEWIDYADYYDEAIASAWTVYLIAKHFPALRPQLGNETVQHMLEPIQHGQFNTLSSALTVLALDALATHDAARLPLPQLAFIADSGSPQAFGAAQGLVQRGAFPEQAKQLLVTAPPGQATTWFSVSQSGFDLQAPEATQNRGLEVTRDYLDDAGNPVQQVPLGGELTVRLRIRALDRSLRSNVAVVDLLPGGFETVLQNGLPPADSGSGSDAQDEAESDAGEADPAADESSPLPGVALPGSSVLAEHVDAREDRVVLYAQAREQVDEFRYRIKANNLGRYGIPPVFAESMYERGVYAQGGPAGHLTVTAPQP